MNLFRRSTPWSLADAVERHAGVPEAASALQVGDAVKLVIVPRDGLRERVWVRVTAVGEEELVGSLRSDPAELRGLRAGDAVTFERRHVLAVARREPSDSPETPSEPDATVGK
ncbi:hypothetical protein [Cellulomonas sp.]|uniref:hypothetical protein n=1 Tax=Cellulomonas sp. TaxID=40001 RepID=UPI003BAB7C89